MKVVLQSPAFVTLWLSEGLSMVGDRLLMVALISLVYDRTGSAGAVGMLMVFKAVPALLLGTWAGLRAGRRLPAQGFRLVLLGLLLVSGISLLI